MRFIDSIEPAGEAETVCIQVAAADSLYVTDDFLVTHNTLNDSFIILDEAQNTSPEQMKMFLTRLGFNSKMVVTGDVTQIDLPRDQRSGLVVIGDILEDVEGIEFVRFGGEDVVRHKLVQRIVAAYNEYAEKQAPGAAAAAAPATGLIEIDLIEAPERLRRAGARRARGGGVRGRPPGGRARRRRGASARSTASTAGRDRPTDVLSFPVDEPAPAAGPRELGDVRDLPRAHRGPDRGRRARRAPPVRLRPRDRRRRDAGAAGRASWSGL